MRRSDILFFGTILIVLVTVVLSTIFGFNLPDWFQFWWCILLPLALLKAFYFMGVIKGKTLLGKLVFWFDTIVNKYKINIK